MDDDYILEYGGTEEDIVRYAEKNGADLTEIDILKDENIKLKRKLMRIENITVDGLRHKPHNEHGDVLRSIRNILLED